MEKPGYKTTEFWVSLLSLLLSALGNYLPPDAPREAIIVTIVYILSRTIVKLVGK